MSKKDTKKLVIVKKVFRQHSCLVVVVPMLLRKDFDLKAGDYLVFNKAVDSKDCKISKFIVKE